MEFSLNEYCFKVLDLTAGKKKYCAYCKKTSTVIFLPCEHQIICLLCSKIYSSNNKCPSCGKQIEQQIETVRLKFSHNIKNF